MTDKDVIYGDEISLRDLVDTLCAGWKYLLVSSVVGATLGAGIWFSQGYKGELTAYVRPGTLNVVSWNALLAGLPGLADVKLYKMDSDAEKERILQALVSPAWWKANTIPTYAISKSDVKDLASISKESLDSGAVALQCVTIKISGNSREEVNSGALYIEEFMRRGALYIALKSLLNQYELLAEKRPTMLRQEMAESESELVFLMQRVQALEALRRDYPDQKGGAVSYVMAPKESAAKYLPLNTQIVAAKSDVNEAKERLSRAAASLEEIEIYRQFVDKALPKLVEVNDGFALEAALQTTLLELKKMTGQAGRSRLLALSVIGRDIDAALASNGKVFEGNPQVLISRPGLSMRLVVGLIGGFLFGLLLIFARAALARSKV